MTQSYRNYIRFYTPHHFVFYPVGLLLLAVGVYMALTSVDWAIWSFASAIVIMVIWLSYMLRQHYALTLQDRIIRLEMQYRFFALTGKRLEDLDHVWTDAELFALRFAPDAELPQMVQFILEGKSASDVKKAIKNWRPDLHRV